MKEGAGGKVRDGDGVNRKGGGLQVMGEETDLKRRSEIHTFLCAVFQKFQLSLITHAGCPCFQRFLTLTDVQLLCCRHSAVQHLSTHQLGQCVVSWLS